MLSARGHSRNDNPPTDALFAPAQDTLPCNTADSRSPAVRRSRSDIRGMRQNGGGGKNGGGGGGSRRGGGSKNRSGGGGKQKKSSKGFESGDTTARPDCCFCLGYHKASGCPNRLASATAPATSNSQHGAFLGSIRTNVGAGLLVATNARPALAARGVLCERHEDEYWVADSGATENMTQNSFNLKNYKPPPPPPPENEVESASDFFSLVSGYGRLRLVVDQNNGTFRGATRELTLAHVAYVP